MSQESPDKWRAKEMLADDERCEAVKKDLIAAGFSIVADALDLARYALSHARQNGELLAMADRLEMAYGDLPKDRPPGPPTSIVARLREIAASPNVEPTYHIVNGWPEPHHEKDCQHCAPSTTEAKTGELAPSMKSERARIIAAPTLYQDKFAAAIQAGLRIEYALKETVAALVRKTEECSEHFQRAIKAERTPSATQDKMDAERYRWLRNHPFRQFMPDQEKEWWPAVWMSEEATYPLQAGFLDQEVDAAIRRSDGGGQKP